MKRTTRRGLPLLLCLCMLMQTFVSAPALAKAADAPGDLLYFVNCAATDTSAVANGDAMGAYQSVTDQPYGEDAETGRTWGYVEDPTMVRGGSKDSVVKTDTYWYTSDSIQYDPETSGFRYNFAVENGSYEVTVGIKIPGWWGARKVDVDLEGTRTINQASVPGGAASNATYIGTSEIMVGDGELNVFIHNAKRTDANGDPILSYILVKRGQIYDKNTLTDKIAEVQGKVEADQAAGVVYAEEPLGALYVGEENKEDNLQALDAAIAEANELAAQDNPNPVDVKNTCERLDTIYSSLRSIETYTTFSGTDGAVWKDTNGKPIQAHGGQVQKLTMPDGSQKWWWIGEDKTTGSHSNGISTYSSDDLFNWTFEGYAMRSVPSREALDTDPYFTALYGDLTDAEKDYVYLCINKTTSIIERPKMIYNEKTGKYIIWFHADGPTEESTSSYAAAAAGMAISDTPNGPFKFIRRSRLHQLPEEEYLEDNGQLDWYEEPANRGFARDMNLFIDDDGTAYIIYSSEENRTMFISRLNDEYTDLDVPQEPVGLAKNGVDFVRLFPGAQREAPALFKYDGVYYMITSGATGWSPNPARYWKADEILGKWTDMGDPCIGDTDRKTFWTQSTNVIPVDPENGKFIYMGDRWGYGKQNDFSAAALADSRYVWLPVEFDARGNVSLQEHTDWDLSIFDSINNLKLNSEMEDLYYGTEDLPKQVNVSIREESGWVTKDVNVDWDFSTLIPGAKVVVTGALEGVDGLTVTANVVDIPENLLYFIDSGATNGSDLYDIVKEKAPNLVNTEAYDQAYSDGSWGYTGTDADIAPKNPTSADYYTSGYWAKGGKNIDYKIPLVAGDYQLTVGFQEWWSTSRPMQVVVSYQGKDGQTVTTNIGKFTNSGEKAFLLPFSVGSDADVTISVQRQNSNNPDPILSWLAVTAAEGKEVVIPQNQMTATADSSASGEGADKAIDGNNNTKWHSSWSSGHPVCPLSITLDLGDQYKDVYQLQYLPRQDSSNGKPQYNGIILGYEISVSNDGQNFTKTAVGNWDANRDLKTATFNATGARYVRLTAISSMGNNAGEYNQFASAAEILVVRKSGFAVKKGSLQAIVNEARAFLDSYEGSEELIADLITAVEKAEDMLSDGTLATQEEVDAAVERVTTAMNNASPATKPTIIPQSLMSITADSQESGNEASKAIDGNTGSFWHSNWSNYTELPHYVTLDLGRVYADVYQMKYLPRQDRDWNGTILQYEISASTDGETFTTVATGEWEPTKDEKTASFPSVAARYLRLKALTSENNESKSFASAAEINVVRLTGFTIDSSMLPPTVEEAKSFMESFTGKESLLEDLKALIARAEALMESATPTQEEFISLKGLIESEIERIQSVGNLKKFTPGDRWLDTEGDFIQAHGGGILYDEKSETYYWYGENKDVDNDPGTTRTPVIGVSCYSSKDLYNWKYEGLALDPKLQTGEYADELAPENVLERPKVIYNDTTGKYVMWAHIDSANYGKACAGVAVSDTPTGPFTYIRSERPNGQMSRDMTLYKDEDGKAYLIYSSENNATLYISLLSDDYLSQSGTYTRNFINMSREAPAMFKHDGKYYIVSSGCTGWSPNAAGYGVADTPLGPFDTLLPNPCVGPDAGTTFRGQSTHVLPVEGRPGKFIFMADRWNANNLQDSRYLWLPMQFNDDGSLRIEWMDEWDLSFLGADYTDLIKVQKEAAKLQQSDYTAESWASLKEALDAAASLPQDAEQATVDKAAAMIRLAIDELVEVAPTDKTIVIRYNGRYASLAVNGEAQALADKLGMYKVPAAAEELVLTFTPMQGREFAGVQVNGEALSESAFETDSFTVTIPAAQAAKGLENVYMFTVVDKQILRVTIDIAEDCADEAAAAAGSVQKKYEAALKAAKAVEKDKTATQDEINDAWSELLDALHYLSFVAGDKTKLETPLNIAEQVDRDRFTPKSVEALDAAVAVAKDLMDDAEVLEADVKAAVDALYDALDNLVARADMSNLAEAVAYGESLDQSKYIDDDALETFNQVLGEAQELLEDANATQEAVNAKAQELLDAIEELRITPNKDTLKELIAKGEKTDTKNVPVSVAKKLADAMDRARVVLADEKSSEADVEEAVNSLQAALKAVEEAKNNQKPDNNSTGKKRSKSTRNISNTYGAAGIVSAAQKVSAGIHCDAAGVITLKRGQSYTLKVTVTNGSGAVPSFTVGNGSVLKTQFVSQYGNEYYFKVYATGAPGQSTGAYAALNGKGVEKLCEVKVVA